MSRLDAVLPLTRADAERAQRLLLPSLLANLNDLQTCWIVVPDREVAICRRSFSTHKVEVVSEYEVVPELRLIDRLGPLVMLGNLPLHPHRRPGRIFRGWYKQQLIKIAAGESLITTPAYLTLDADVLCTRPTDADELLPDGRALIELRPEPEHPLWYRRSARALCLPMPSREMSVTPALLVCDVIRRLADWLGPRWRRSLISRLPWTEYAVYLTFLEAEGITDVHHVPGQLLSDGCWHRDAWRDWEPGKLFTRDAPAPFTLVQSHLGVPVEEIEARISDSVDWLPRARRS